MIDELETLRAIRSSAERPRATARDAARARWDREPLELTTVAPPRPARGARAFTTRTAIAAIVSVALLAGGWLITRERISSVKPKHVLSVRSLTAAAATDPQVFLLVGSDSRAFVRNPDQANQFGDPSDVTGARSDTIMLVRIDPTTRHVLVVSIPRDLWIDVPGCGTRKINATFNSALACGSAHGGAQLLVETITKSLGVPVNHVIEVHFAQFGSLVDQLGGLRIRFPEPARDAYTGLDQQSGCVTLTGEQALAFVRSRHYETFRNGQWREDPRADLARVERQRLALAQLAVAAESRVGSDPRPMLRALFANVTVDSGFTSDDALRYFAALRGDHPTITMTLPVKVAIQADQDVLLLDPGAQSVLDALAGRGKVPASPGSPAGSGAPAIVPTAC